MNGIERTHIIHTTEEFSILIKKERGRTDRTGKAFSLVAFSTNINFRNKNLQTDLKKHSRLIDELGWLKDDRLGILLPLTPFEGAHLLAVKIVGNEVNINYQVYVYPDHWISEYEEEAEEVNMFNEDNTNELFLANTKEENNNKINMYLEERKEAIEQKNIIMFGKGKNMHEVLIIKNPIWKRIIDIFGSLMFIILFSPLFILTAMLIKIVSPGPVFFVQKRVGKGEKLFNFLKFRTMKNNNNQKEHQEHIVKKIRAGTSLDKMDKLDKRIFFSGRFLRLTCIDELPQLFNVFLGNMSLVGPRPCLPYEAKQFLNWHSNRFDILPGMTGLWQVSGKNRLTVTQMIRLDIKYQNTLSLKNDIIILLRTFPAILLIIFDKD